MKGRGRLVLRSEGASPLRRVAVVSVFRDVGAFARALKRLKELGERDLAIYSPVGLPALEPLFPKQRSPIRFVVLAAGIVGCAGAFWMCIGSALLYGLIVGGKWPASILPYCVIAFELTVLLGGLTALAAIILAVSLSNRAVARLRPGRPAVAYDPRFGEDRFGLCVTCAEDQVAPLAAMLREAGAEEVHEQRAAEI